MIAATALVGIAVILWLVSLGAALSFEDTQNQRDGLGMLLVGALALALAFAAGTQL